MTPTSKQENNDKAYASDKKMLYRYPKDDYYADSVSLENGKICMQVGGHTVCKSIKDWHSSEEDYMEIGATKMRDEVAKTKLVSDRQLKQILTDVIKDYKYRYYSQPKMNSKQESLEWRADDELQNIILTVINTVEKEYSENHLTMSSPLVEEAKAKLQAYCKRQVIEELEDTVKLMEVFDTAEGEAVRKHLSAVVKKLKGDLE